MPAAKKAPRKARMTPTAKPKARPAKAAKPTAGAQSDGKAVDAWIAARAAERPERRDVLRRIDAILREEIPDVVRTTKYRKPSDPLGTPFYGRPGHGWVAMVHSLKHEMRVTYFAGPHLVPPPPVAANAGTRRVDIPGADDLDERQVRAWTRQAARLPGWGRV